MTNAEKQLIERDRELKLLDDSIDDLERQIRKLEDLRDSRIAKIREESRQNLRHLQVSATKLVEEAKALKDAVPEKIVNFIKCITTGVDHSAGFQIVWWNERFVILRLPGRKFWSGRSETSYAKASTRLYDLQKFHNEKAACSGNVETRCLVKKINGKVSTNQLNEMKTLSDYVAA